MRDTTLRKNTHSYIGEKTAKLKYWAGLSHAPTEIGSHSHLVAAAEQQETTDEADQEEVRETIWTPMQGIGLTLREAKSCGGQEEDAFTQQWDLRLIKKEIARSVKKLTTATMCKKYYKV